MGYIARYSKIGLRRSVSPINIYCDFFSAATIPDNCNMMPIPIINSRWVCSRIRDMEIRIWGHSVISGSKSNCPITVLKNRPSLSSRIPIDGKVFPIPRIVCEHPKFNCKIRGPNIECCIIRNLQIIRRTIQL